MNSSENYDNETHALPFGNAEIVTAAVLIIPLCVFGIVANILTIFTISYSRKLKSPFFNLILSLSASDLLSALISPFALYRLTWGYEVWMWPDIFCKLFWAADIWTSYVTSIHILYFSALRFSSVQWPFRFKTFTPFRAKIIIAIAWIVTFGSGFFPTVLWYDGLERNRTLSAPQLPSCSLRFEKVPILQSYRKVAYPLFFYVPFFFIVIFSIGFGVVIYQARKKREQLQGKANRAANRREARQEKQMLVQLGLIVGSYLLGYVPRSAYHFFSVNRINKDGYEPYPWWFAFIEYLLLRITECLNPVFYNLSSSKMRKETKATVKLIWFRTKRKRAVALTLSSNPNSKTELTLVQNYKLANNGSSQRT